ncbi:type II TA system antitoxin MqsA family protein [Butyrivibrio sp. FC2001]|uniref:type II TA system antitoxin MqsA family protein n=1 Tax=Butyrivibrio sp. FC2001 TaxID=1280671 RepID=UPI0003FEB10C|nr:type II TA system antitoxin MqsA family protein [Butyrivibrio sp. FC2001]
MNKGNRQCNHKNYEIISKEETYPVHGEDTTILANVKVCKDCGEEIFDFKLDDENLKRAFLKYKKNHALMTSSEIIELRNKYGLSQRTLAVLIGCSQSTIVRYEKGDIQNNTHNNIMRMLTNPDNMDELLDIKEEELTPRDVNAIREKIAKNNENEKRELFSIKYLGDYLHIKPDQYSGFRDFDFEKFSNMICYFADRITDLYKTKLFKLLFYSDMYFFRNYTVSISGMNYVHQHYGPVPTEYSLLLGLIEKNGDIRIEEVATHYGIGEIVHGTNQCRYSSLSEDELEVLEIVCNKFGLMSAREISDYSHKEKGYLSTLNLEKISYKYAMEMKE